MTDRLSANDASINVEKSKLILEVPNMISITNKSCTDPMRSMYKKS